MQVKAWGCILRTTETPVRVEISTHQHFPPITPKLMVSRVQMLRQIKMHNLLQNGTFEGQEGDW